MQDGLIDTDSDDEDYEIKKGNNLKEEETKADEEMEIEEEKPIFDDIQTQLFAAIRVIITENKDNLADMTQKKVLYLIYIYFLY